MTPTTKKRMVMDRAGLQRRVVTYLGRFLTSEARLRGYIERLLRRWQDRGEIDLNQHDVAEIIDWAVRGGYVDDQRFAESYVARGYQSGLSMQAIRQRLNAEQIAPELVRRVIEAFLADQGTSVQDMDRASAMHYARKRGIGPFRSREREQWYKRDLGKLARRGYSREIALWVLSQADQSSQTH